MNEYIDLTCIDMDTTILDIEKACKEATKYHYVTVCVNAYYIPFAKKALEESTVSVSCLLSNGMTSKEVKVYEAISASEEGADEIDMPINIGALKDKDYMYIKEEIEEVRDAISGKLLKVVISLSTITDEQLIKLIKICNETFIHFIVIKAEIDDVDLLRKIQIIKKYKNELLEIKILDCRENIEKWLDIGINRIGIPYNEIGGNRK